MPDVAHSQGSMSSTFLNCSANLLAHLALIREPSPSELLSSDTTSATKGWGTLRGSRWVNSELTRSIMREAHSAASRTAFWVSKTRSQDTSKEVSNPEIWRRVLWCLEVSLLLILVTLRRSESDVHFDEYMGLSEDLLHPSIKQIGTHCLRGAVLA
jgi:hypothetical protein